MNTQKNTVNSVEAKSSAGLEIRRFIAWIRPCIKAVPRNANTEPSQDGDFLEGVETTKMDLETHE